MVCFCFVRVDTEKGLFKYSELGHGATNVSYLHQAFRNL